METANKNSEERINEQEEIKNIILELLEKMNIAGEVEIRENTQEDAEKTCLVYNIKTHESNYLIGQYGVNLQALQHITRLLARKKTNETAFNFILDVNLYRQEKDKSVLILAREASQKALAEKKAVTLRPMSPYERRLVHMELSENDQVRTEGIGEGEDRRVVVRPVNM